ATSIFVVAVLAGSLPALWMRPWFFWLVGGVFAGILVGLGTRALLLARARRRLLELGQEFAVRLAQTQRLGRELQRQREDRASAEQAGCRRKQEADRQAAHADHKPLLDDLLRRARAEREALEQQFQKDFQTRRHAAREAVQS